MPRRRQTEQQARDDRDSEREEQNAAVHRDDGLARQGTWWDLRPQPAEQPVADDEPGEAAARGKQDVFSEKLPDEPPAAGPEGGADRHLTFTRDAACEREIGEVRAADEQHHRGRCQQDHQGRAQLRSHERIGVPLDDHAPALVRVGEVLLDPGADRAHVGLRLLKGHALFQSGEREQPVEIPGHVRRLERERPPKLIEGAVEGAPRRQDADDGVRFVVQQDRPVDNRWVGAELVDPQDVAQDDDLFLPEPIFIGQKRPTQRGPNAEDLEEVWRDSAAAQLNRVAGAGECGRPAGLGGHEIEDLVVLLPVEEIQRGDAVPVAARRLFEHAHDAIGVVIRQRTEHQAVHEAEDRRVGADAERQRQDRHRREAWACSERSQGVTQVLKD